MAPLLQSVLLLCAIGRGLSLHSTAGLRLERTCADDWSQFGVLNPLRCSQRVHSPRAPSDFSNFSHGSHFQGVFVDPQSNFAVCTIEKNACKAWSPVFYRLQTKMSIDRVGFGIVQESFSRAGAAAVTRLFSNPLAVRAVVIRDPLARFASAFMDKCYADACANSYCLARSTSDKHTAISFSEAVRWMLASDPRALDGHWRLQSEHCELRDRVHEYTHILRFEALTLSSDVSCLMDLADIAHGDADFMSRTEEEVASSMPEDTLLRKLYTPEAARLLLAHLHQDYEVFHLPEPSWISNASGEWYDTLDQDRCVDEHT